MSERETKDALYEGFATVARALGSGRRAELVDVLAQGERSVEELARELGQSVATTSHHLRHLARAGLVRTRRSGTRVIYSLASERVEELWTAVRDIAVEHVAEVDRLVDDYLGADHEHLESVSRQELARRVAQAEVVVIDVRPRGEYVAGHLPQARSIPVAELDEHIDALPRDAEIVVYCRGPYCVFAHDAVRRLRARGHHAVRLEDGFPEWRRAGLPIEHEDGVRGQS